MKTEECPGTLLLRAHQVSLSSSEALALQAHLDTCQSCQVLSLVLSDFDDVPSERHDGMRIERLASFARQRTIDDNRARFREVTPTRLWGARGPWAAQSGPTSTRVALLAAAAFLMVAGASAAIVVQDAVQDGDPKKGQAISSELGLPAAEQARRVLSVAARQALEVSSEAMTPGGLARPEARAALGDCARLGCKDAATLFKQANAARRSGETGDATRSYQELQRLYPGSPEAQLSHVSLGHLLLNAGRGALALTQFDAALRSSAAKSVQAEALYGKGLSLARLGRGGEERATWQRLLRDFPESPYASQARRRLGNDD